VPVEVRMPQLALSMTEGTVGKWLKTEGETVQAGEPLVEVLTEKVATEIAAPASGVLQKIMVPEGATVPVDTVLAVIATGEEGATPTVGQQPAPAQTTAGEAAPGSAHAAPAPATEDRGRVFASPAARRLAREHGVDLRQVRGTGPGGRIIMRDVLRVAAELAERAAVAVAETARAAPTPPAPAAPTPAPAPAAPAARAIPLAGMRRIIAERMVQSRQTTAPVTLTVEVDMAEAVKLRQQLLGEWERTHGLRLSYTDLIVRAVAKALREHPRLNASLVGDEIRLHEEINIGVAVALDDGLIVPVVHQADRKSLLEIALAIRDLADRARRNALTPADVAGGTFTVTNLGMYGTDIFTPIINPPECAILGVGRIVERPAVREGQLVARPLIWLSLTFDHRIVDGAPAAQFLQRVQEILEKPYLLLV